MIRLGQAAKHIRERRGLNQKDGAALLGISNVYLCNIENDKASPSSEVVARYQDRFGVDLYVLAWCLFGDVTKLPPGVRKAAKELGEAWKQTLGSDVSNAR